MVGSKQLINNRQTEGGRFTGAGLGQTDQIIALQHKRDGFGLNGGRCVKTKLIDCLQQAR